jgi:hypothetical protein
MRHTRIAAFLLGAWLLGTLFMIFVATQNFGTVDRVLKSPPPEALKMIATLGNDSARQLLRYAAGEENRFFFENWEVAQLVLGTLLTGLLVFGVESRMLAGFSVAMLILTIFEHLKITPEMAWLGRSFDFLPSTTESMARDQFWKLHGVYSAIEIVKILLAVVIAGFLFQMRQRRRKQRVQVKAVDYTQHRHVDG